MKRVLMLSLILSALAGRAQAEPIKTGMFYASLAAADLYSTSYAEARGAVEKNPLMKSQGSRYALKVAQVGVLTYLDHRAGKRSKKLQWGIRIFSLGVAAYVTQHNMKQGRR